MSFSPLTKRRLDNFIGNKRGYYSALIFSFIFVATLFAEFLANDKPIFLYFDSKIHFPTLEKIPEVYFGGEFETEADYKDPFVKKLITTVLFINVSSNGVFCDITKLSFMINLIINNINITINKNRIINKFILNLIIF